MEKKDILIFGVLAVGLTQIFVEHNAMNNGKAAVYSIYKEKNQINSMAPNLSKPHRIEQGHSEQKAPAHSYRPIP